MALRGVVQFCSNQEVMSMSCSEVTMESFSLELAALVIATLTFVHQIITGGLKSAVRLGIATTAFLLILFFVVTGTQWLGPITWLFSGLVIAYIASIMMLGTENRHAVLRNVYVSSAGALCGGFFYGLLIGYDIFALRLDSFLMALFSAIVLQILSHFWE